MDTKTFVKDFNNVLHEVVVEKNYKRVPMLSEIMRRYHELIATSDRFGLAAVGGRFNNLKNTESGGKYGDQRSAIGMLDKTLERVGVSEMGDLDIDDLTTIREPLQSLYQSVKESLEESIDDSDLSI